MTQPWSDKDLNGKHLRFGSFIRPPFVTFERREEGGEIHGIGGFCFEIVHALRDAYNFTYSVISPPELGTGTLAPNGSWNGIIGMLHQGELDMGVGPFSITFARQQVVDFTVAFYEEPTAILIPPPSLEMRMFACTWPFKTEVWIGLIVALIVVPLILWCQAKASARLVVPSSSSLWQTSNLAQQFTFAYGVLTHQSGQRISRNVGHSAIILSLVWCLIAVVFIHAYIGTLMAFLSVPKLKPIITGLDDLPKSRLDWYVRRGTDLESLFLEAEGGIYKLIGNGLRKRPDRLANDSQIGPQKVLNGSSAYITGKSFAEFVISERLDQQCSLSLAKDTFYKVNQAFALPKNSPLLPLFNRKIMQMTETGLMDYWKKKLWPSSSNNRRCNTAGPRREGPRSLSLDDMQSPFVIWGIGSGLALIVFILEKMIHWIYGHRI